MLPPVLPAESVIGSSSQGYFLRWVKRLTPIILNNCYWTKMFSLLAWLWCSTKSRPKKSSLGEFYVGGLLKPFQRPLAWGDVLMKKGTLLSKVFSQQWRPYPQFSSANSFCNGKVSHDFWVHHVSGLQCLKRWFVTAASNYTGHY